MMDNPLDDEIQTTVHQFEVRKMTDNPLDDEIQTTVHQFQVRKMTDNPLDDEIHTHKRFQRTLFIRTKQFLLLCLFLINSVLLNIVCVWFLYSKVLALVNRRAL